MELSNKPLFERFDPQAHSDLLNPLTDLLHEAYASLAAKGMRYLATHQSAFFGLLLTVMRTTSAYAHNFDFTIHDKPLWVCFLGITTEQRNAAKICELLKEEKKFTTSILNIIEVDHFELNSPLSLQELSEHTGTVCGAENLSFYKENFT